MNTSYSKAIFGKGFVGEVLVFLAKPPRTYMNLSGELVNCSRKQFPIHLAVHFWLHLWNLNFIEHTHIAGWKLNQRARPIIIDPALYLSKKSDLALTTQRRTLPTSFKLFSGYWNDLEEELKYQGVGTQKA
ncbi:hypothetical protein VIGAN_03186300 [Vigna angularis var. angularis]|uniref:Uncharacterized protein n=1 Tax=Vigna angularis var. angularis TaxID=157739 RepID=A0A0S3RN43_PHAAN|nr:hypothetical protein VIGAN_03186300 [Vigna angularis var. angularis]